MTFAESQVVYRDLTGPWGNFRLIIGGKNVTHFRGVPAQIGGYQLQEPYGYGPADFSLPQVSNLEVDMYGEPGSLHWLDKGKPVKLVQVRGGSRVRTVWEGFVTVLNPTNAGLQIHCDGDASGRLALKDRHPALFVFTKDIGRWMFDAFRLCNLTLRPHLGPDTGIDVDSRGRSGTYLSYTDGLLADAMTLDGDQWTVMPEGDHYRMRLKDTTTIDFTVFNGAAGVELDVSSDLSEEPTSIFGSGTDPSGQVWVNGRYPGIVQGQAPDFPGSMSVGDTDADTSSGSGITDLNSKLIGMGYLDREDATSTFNPDTVDAVQDLQDDANLPQTGVVDLATWRSLFDLSDTGLSLREAWVAPLAQISAVRKYNHTANGSLAERNPHFDRKRIEVDLSVDHGPGVKKSRARAWSKRKLNQVQNGKNWTGTLNLTADVVAGDVAFADLGESPALMSRLDIVAGMNVKVRHFDGTTKFHVAGVNVSSDLSVSLAVDTKARDLLTLGQIIQRNRESRVNPARQWLRQHRGTDANHAQIQWSEVGGRIFTAVDCPGDQWTVFPVVAGQAGSVDKIRIQTSSSPAAFVCVVTAKQIGPKYLHAKVGNPFDTNSHGESKWTNSNVQADMDDDRAVLGVWGDDSQPCGYAPRAHTNSQGNATDAPITGLLVDTGGFDYHTFDQPVLYVGIYPKTDTKIRPQRIMWPVLEAGS